MRLSSEFLHFTQETEKNRNISATVRPIATKFFMMTQNVSQVRRPLKFILKIQDGGRPIRLRGPFCIIMRYCNLSIFKMAAVRSSWNFEIEVFKSQSLQRHVLH